MEYREQIIAYAYAKIRELENDIKENKLTQKEILTSVESIEDLMRDYFNLID